MRQDAAGGAAPGLAAQAITAFRLLGYTAELSMEQQCNLAKQYKQIAKGCTNAQT